jgi:hypothetical protein
MTMMMKKNMMKKKVRFLMADSIDNIFFISGAQLLEKMIASVLKPKSRQKEAFMQVRIYLSLYQIILLIILII